MIDRRWFPGFVIGVWSGFLLIYGPVIGLLLAAAFAVGAARARAPSAIAGLFLGIAGILGLVILLIHLNCTGLYDSGPEGCTPPDQTVRAAVAATAAVAGLIVLIAFGERRGPFGRR